MNKVQRWACDNSAENMVPFSLGSWVETTDYDKLESENERLKANIEEINKHRKALWDECNILTSKIDSMVDSVNKVSLSWSIYENGLIETPEWVKRSQLRDSISKLWNMTKDKNK